MHYNPAMLSELQVGDVLRLKKPHPCGSFDWKVVGLGADIRLECLGCGHKVFIPRRKLALRIKTISAVGEAHADPERP
jgi:hypothetical protein